MTAAFAEYEEYESSIIRSYGPTTLFKEGTNDHTVSCPPCEYYEGEGSEDDAVALFWRHVNAEHGGRI